MLRIIALLSLLTGLVACTNPNDLDKPPPPLGDFKLGHNIAVAPNITKGPLSRDASKDEWIAALTKAVDERFSRYDGDKLYHLAFSIEGYVLAMPGVPIIASPSSALILDVTVWDDAAGAKLNEKPKQITIIESFSGATIIGSGLTQSKEQQMTNLTRNAAKQIQNWLMRQKREEDWFGGTQADGKAAASVAALKPPEDLPDAAPAMPDR